MKTGLLAGRISATLTCLCALALVWAGGVEAKRKDYVLTLNGYVAGKLLFPQIELWSTPGGPATGGKVTERLRSGTKVKIVGRVVLGRTTWYLVTNFGPVEIKSGWVAQHFLRPN